MEDSGASVAHPVGEVLLVRLREQIAGLPTSPDYKADLVATLDLHARDIATMPASSRFDLEALENVHFGRVSKEARASAAIDRRLADLSETVSALRVAVRFKSLMLAKIERERAQFIAHPEWDYLHELSQATLGDSLYWATRSKEGG